MGSDETLGLRVSAVMRTPAQILRNTSCNRDGTRVSYSYAQALGAVTTARREAIEEAMNVAALEVAADYGTACAQRVFHAVKDLLRTQTKGGSDG